MLAFHRGPPCYPGVLVWASLQHGCWVPGRPEGKKESGSQEERRFATSYDLVSVDMLCYFGHILVMEAVIKSCLGLRGGDMGSVSWLGASRFYKGMWDWKACWDHFLEKDCHNRKKYTPPLVRGNTKSHGKGETFTEGKELRIMPYHAVIPPCPKSTDSQVSHITQRSIGV